MSMPPNQRRTNDGTCWLHDCAQTPTYWLLDSSIGSAYACCEKHARDISSNSKIFRAEPMERIEDPEAGVW